MNKEVIREDLISLLAESKGLDIETATSYYKQWIDLILERILAHESVEVKGLGTFQLTEVDSEEIENAATGDVLEIPAHAELSFIPAEAMLDKVNASLKPETEKQLSVEEIVNKAAAEEIAWPDNYLEIHRKQKFLKRRLPVIIGIILIVIIAIYSFVKLFDMSYVYREVSGGNNDNVNQVDSMVSIAIDTTKSSVVPKDSSMLLAKGISSKTDSIQKYVTLETGNTLRSISVKYFGDKVYWVYLYQENRDIISDPSKISVGMKLKIPNVSKYNINVNDPQSIAAARKFESTVMAEIQESKDSK